MQSGKVIYIGGSWDAGLRTLKASPRERLKSHVLACHNGRIDIPCAGCREQLAKCGVKILPNVPEVTREMVA